MLKFSTVLICVEKPILTKQRIWYLAHFDIGTYVNEMYSK